jgi:hypothetical protein
MACLYCILFIGVAQKLIFNLSIFAQVNITNPTLDWSNLTY